LGVSHASSTRDEAREAVLSLKDFESRATGTITFVLQQPSSLPEDIFVKARPSRKNPHPFRRTFRFRGATPAHKGRGKKERTSPLAMTPSRNPSLFFFSLTHFPQPIAAASVPAPRGDVVCWLGRTAPARPIALDAISSCRQDRPCRRADGWRENVAETKKAGPMLLAVSAEVRGALRARTPAHSGPRRTRARRPASSAGRCRIEPRAG